MARGYKRGKGRCQNTRLESKEKLEGGRGKEVSETVGRCRRCGAGGGIREEGREPEIKLIKGKKGGGKGKKAGTVRKKCS